MDHQKYGTVVVTGASTGIGRATALQLDQLGFKVFATVRNERDAQALHSASSENLIPVLMDVTDPASIISAKEQVGYAVGDEGLAGLVNNAGIAFQAPLEFVPLDKLRWLFDVNVFGLLAVTQAFLPLLRQRRGRIVDVSSSATLFVVPFHGPYSASKLAVNGLSDALRLELKPFGVQVSVLICGNMKTPIWEKAGQFSDQVAEGFPPQAMELYGQPYRKLREYFVRLGKAGISPETVARQVAHALTARRAKNTYFVGPDAVLHNIVNKIAYGRLRDWLVYRVSV